jgi:general secretion pathway protein K
MMRLRASRQRGVALILVIWVSVLVTVIASSFIVERRTETMVIRNSMSMARAAAVADAGVSRAVFEAYRSDNGADVWKRDGTVYEWSFDGTASDALLRGLLVAAGLNDDDASRLLDAILDWRDPDALKRVNGAEEADYQAAGLSYRPANGQFQAIEEIQLVLGMRPDIYRRIAPSITVFSRLPGVNPQFASRDVLLAIPGMTSEIVDEYIARREDARSRGEPLPALAQAAAFSAGTSMILRVRAEARLDDGTYFAREAVGILRSTMRKPVTFVAWRESTQPPEIATETPGNPPSPPASR